MFTASCGLVFCSPNRARPFPQETASLDCSHDVMRRSSAFRLSLDIGPLKLPHTIFESVAIAFAMWLGGDSSTGRDCGNMNTHACSSKCVGEMCNLVDPEGSSFCLTHYWQLILVGS